MIKNFPLVSVIIPLYNAESYIRETVLSVQNQSYPNIEIIIVDDGSTDDSYKVALEFSSAKCKVISQKNQGACSARNLGIEESKGDYLQFLDADDVLSKDKILHQVEEMSGAGKNIVAICAWYYFENDTSQIRKNDLEIFRSYANPLELLIDMWAGQQFLSPACYLIHRSILEKSGTWDETISNNQDGEFFCRVLVCADQVVFSQGISYYRTNLPNSVSRGIGSYKNADSRLKTYLLYEHHVRDYMHIDKMKKALSANYYYFIYVYYEKYPDLVKVAIQKTKELGSPPPIELGGKSFQKLSKIFGFFQVLRVRKMIKS